MTTTSTNIRLRITALWAFSEAFLGGILHAFHIPFAGLILSSFAVLCMVAISLQGPSKGEIIKATLLVIIIKALLSPHTPVSAYFAVLLQGAMGELLFLSGMPFTLSCLLLGIASLLQSAFQKLIILTLIFGVDFWKALDEFLNSINKMMGLSSISYSIYLIAVYVGLHLIAGIFVGIFSGRLPHFFSQSAFEFNSQKFEVPTTLTLFPLKKTTKNRFTKPIYWILFILLFIALYETFFSGKMPPILGSKAFKLILRSSIFLLLWYFIVAPILLMLFQKWLAKQQSKFSKEVDSILKLIPEMKYISEQCWQRTSTKRSFKRISTFVRFTFFMLLAKQNADIHS